MRTRYHWISVSVTPFCMFQIAFSLPHAFLPFHLICMWHYHHSTQVLYKIGQKSVTDYYCFRLWWLRKRRVWMADVVGMCLVMSRVHEVRTPSVPCATLGPAFHLPPGSHLHLTWNVDNDSQPPSPCAAVQVWFTWSKKPQGRRENWCVNSGNYYYSTGWFLCSLRRNQPWQDINKKGYKYPLTSYQEVALEKNRCSKWLLKGWWQQICQAGLIRPEIVKEKNLWALILCQVLYHPFTLCITSNSHKPYVGDTVMLIFIDEETRQRGWITCSRSPS